jgi:hypothetical protein
VGSAVGRRWACKARAGTARAARVSAPGLAPQGRADAKGEREPESGGGGAAAEDATAGPRDGPGQRGRDAAHATDAEAQERQERGGAEATERKGGNEQERAHAGRKRSRKRSEKAEHGGAPQRDTAAGLLPCTERRAPGCPCSANPLGRRSRRGGRAAGERGCTARVGARLKGHARQAQWFGRGNAGLELASGARQGPGIEARRGAAVAARRSPKARRPRQRAGPQEMRGGNTETGQRRGNDREGGTADGAARPADGARSAPTATADSGGAQARRQTEARAARGRRPWERGPRLQPAQ